MTKRVTIGAGYLLVLLLVMAGGGAVAGSWVTSSSSSGEEIQLAAPRPELPDVGVRSGGFGALAESVVPSVANVSSSKIVRTQGSGPVSPFFNDPFFRNFFGDGFSRQFEVPREQRERSLGSAVIVSPDGYLLTNNHVVEGASEIEVTLADGKVLSAQVVGTDPKTDIAVIRVDEHGLPALPFGDSDSVRVGDYALAIGNPFGLGQTVTFGIVSATGRSGLGIEEYEDFIQTDAAINPGNSGGALVNDRGELIGINTAILGESGGNQGIGFAVPAALARNVMDQILRNGKVTRSWLGIVVQPVTDKEASAFGLDETRGVLVGDVTPHSPAEKAGIERGDIVLAIDGDAVDDVSRFRLRVAGTAPGTQIALDLFRQEKEIHLDATLEEMPEEAPDQTPAEAEPAPGVLGGLTLESLTPDLASELDLPRNAHGAVVVRISPASAAADAGLRTGDVIQELNRQPIQSAADFDRVVRASRPPYLLLVNRGGTTSYIVVEAE